MRLAQRAAWLLAAPWRLVVLVALVAALPILVAGELAAADTTARHDAAAADTARRAAGSAAASFADRVSAISLAVGNAATRTRFGQITPLIAALDEADANAAQSALEEMRRFVDPAVTWLLVLDLRSHLVVANLSAAGSEGTDLSAQIAPTSGTRAVEVGDAFAWNDSLILGPGGSFTTGQNAARSVAISVTASIGTTQALGYRLAAVVRLSALAGPAAAQLRTTYQDVYLVDRGGHLALRASRTFSPDDMAYRDLSGSPAVASLTSGVTDPLAPERVVRGVARVPEIGWSVLIVDAPNAIDADLEAALGQQRALRVGLAAVLLLGAVLVGSASSTAIRRRREIAEALEQQTATADVLKTISRSAFDLQAVFDVVVENATKLCRGEWGYLFRKEGDVFRLIATHGGTPALIEYERAHPTVISDRTLIGRVALRRGVVHIPDLFDDPDYDWPSNREHGVHTVLGVPIFRADEVVGAIGVARNERSPFSDADIRLVQTFADQATIAMENVRLFNETKESLGQQTALSDVLRTISRSAFDLDAVLHTIVERAAALGGAETAGIFRKEGNEAVVLAQFGPVIPAAVVVGTRFPVNEHTLIGRALLTGERQYVADAALHPELPQDGPRTRLMIPFLRGGEAIGVLSLSHNLPRPFGDRELQMLETFADQAAIAIENVRLFNETKESLERQTALAAILRVIASSPSDQQPVFDTIALNATRYCGAEDAAVQLVQGDESVRVAHHGAVPYQVGPNARLERTSVAGRAILDARTVHVADITGPAGDEFPTTRQRAAVTGQRGMLATPLLREGKAIGAILLRKIESGGFTPSQIQLVEAFADQAVIAIENVRLFNETKEALKQRTATSEILRVISETLGDPQPVMQAIVDTVLAVCSADSAGFFRRSGDDLILRAVSGVWRGPRPSVGNELPFHGDSIVLLALEEGRYRHVPDTSADPRYDAAALWSRTRLAVPVLRGSETLGVIRVGRSAPGGFSEREIHLVEGFAEQAAIAFENARLFNETKEALERQTAVAQVLGAISQSAFELRPVLETVVEHATKLCAAQQGFIYRRENDVYRLAVAHGITPEFKAFTEANPLSPVGRGTITGRVAQDRMTVHVPDVLKDPEYTYWEAQKLGNFRALLGVPMIRDDEVIGVMLLWRTEPRPFTDQQIDLVTTFANQATIAVENVRLFDETKEALEQQTAVGEVLKAISRSAFDLDPILGTVVENAARMADADFAWIARREKGQLVGGARYASDGDTTPFEGLAAVIATARSNRTGESISARVLNSRRTIHIEDITLDRELAAASPVAKATGSRTVLAVPLLAEGEVIGAILVTRRAVRAFTDREVKVVETFADQAAIAIQNVRLFNEIQDKSRQLEIANRHKSEFLANMSHELRTPLNAIIGFSEVLVQGLFGDVNEKQREYLQDVIGSGQHLLTLINDILDLSKIEAGRMELELSTFSLRNALQSGVTIVRERASRHNITLSVVVADELGQVEADERKVKQILYNLLSNAVKFTHDGGRVDVTVRPDNGDVRVDVRDNGIGIADADKARIFEEFQQVGRERSREGTGLGLTLTRRFVELHGGRIWVESAPGQGSTFAFTLPLRQAAPVRA